MLEPELVLVQVLVQVTDSVLAAVQVVMVALLPHPLQLQSQPLLLGSVQALVLAEELDSVGELDSVEEQETVELDSVQETVELDLVPDSELVAKMAVPAVDLAADPAAVRASESRKIPES